jgi:hypothetical protein
VRLTDGPAQVAVVAGGASVVEKNARDVDLNTETGVLQFVSEDGRRRWSVGFPFTVTEKKRSRVSLAVDESGD